MTMRSRYRAIALVITLGAASVPGHARDGIEDGGERVLEEIIVTATRRDTALQDTPLSIGVLTAQDIEDSGALHIFDYWRMIPSLAVTDWGFAGNRFIIRGLSGSSGPETDESLTANYLDDTLLVSPQGLFTHAPSFRLVDINRVEVLRGPQGTLFGAGSMGGAIRLITNQPDVTRSTQSYEAVISNTAHGDLNFGVTGVWNLPVVEDRSALRIVAYRFDDDGYIDDIGQGQDNANGVTTTGLRLSGTARVSDQFEITGKIAYEDMKLDGFTFVDPNGKPPVGLIITGDYQSALMTDEWREEETVLYNLNLNYSSAAGDFVSVTSYFDSETDAQLDISESINVFFGVFFPAWAVDGFRQKAFMQEIRFASDTGGRFDWLAGAFYSDMTFDRGTVLPAPGFNAVCGGCTGLPDGEETALVSDVDDDRRELGLFVDVSFWFTERLQGSLGVRWYDLRRTAHEVATGLFADPNLPVATREFENEGVNGKASLSYKLSDDTMLYALVSEGFRPGGANEQGAAFLCNTEQTFDSDSIVNFEVGAKTQFFDNRLLFNTALYHAKWDDAQLLVQPRCGFSVGINSGGVTAEGIEVETTYLPNDRWELSLNAGYMNPTLDNDVPDIGAPAGRRLSNVPDVTANFSSTYRFPAFGGRQGFARADIQHVGSIYTEIGNVGRPRIELDPYTLVNLRTGIEGRRWRVTLFADNVFDEQATILCCRDNGEFTINRPRTIGIRARYSAD
jgi:outer membrane receptor protein involved in Fe transport